jgi:hypothetical protein
MVDVIKHPSKDLVTIDFSDKNLTRFKDITGRFKSEFQCFRDKQMSRLMYRTRAGAPVVYAGTSVAGKDAKFSEEKDGETKYYFVSSLYYSDYRTGPGYCGSLLASEDGRYIGIHFASDDRSSLAVSVVQEDFVRTTTIREAPVELKMECGVTPWLETSECGSMEVLGVLKSPEYSAANTTLRKSTLFEQISPATTQPPILSPYDPRNPTKVHPKKLGIQKYDNYVAAMDEPSLQKIADLVDYDLGQETRVRPGVLTDHQVLNGDYLVPRWKGMDMSTSPGYGYKKTSRGKKPLFIEDEKGLYSIAADSQVRREIDQMERDMFEGVINQVVVIDSLKDEKVSHQKVLDVKTRVFNILPVPQQFLCMKYFGKAVSHMLDMEANETSPYAMGIDPESKSWHRKITHLLFMSDKGFDGDGKSFDANYVLREMYSVVVKRMAAWAIRDGEPTVEDLKGELEVKHGRRYTAEQIREAMHILALSQVTAFHLADSFAFATYMGMLSGSFLTTSVNSLIMRSHLYVAYNTCVKPEFRTLSQFVDNVAMLVFGDDHIVAPSEDVPEFNFQSVFRYFQTLGMTYTSGRKVAVEERERWSVLEMQFLKRNTRRMGNQYVSYLDRKVILESINWIRKCDDAEQATVDNAKTALRYMWFHGRQEFNWLRDKLKELRPAQAWDDYASLEGIWNAYDSEWEPSYRSPYNQAPSIRGGTLNPTEPVVAAIGH